MHSPKIVCTPVKRLGIVRRKSSITVKNLLKNSLTPNRNSPSSDSHKILESFLTPSKLLKSLKDIENADSKFEDVQQLTMLKKRLLNLKDVSELDISISMWRNGCREALLELQALIKTEDDIKMSCQTLSRKLGIWSVIKENFQDDSEIVSSDEEDL